MSCKRSFSWSKKILKYIYKNVYAFINKLGMFYFIENMSISVNDKQNSHA